VLQDGEFSRLGSNRRVTADVRIVAATNRDLEGMLTRSEFREDLYYRLKVIEIVVPPLRERTDEIPQLVEFFSGKYAKRYNRREPNLTPALMDAMQTYTWPGNVRELENVVKRFVILQDEGLLLRELRPIERRMYTPAVVEAPVAAMPEPAAALAGAAQEPAARPSEHTAATTGANGSVVPPAGPQSLAEVARLAMLKAERDLIVPTLRRVHWNRRKAAPLLGISYKTLLNKIKEQGIVQD
jgi:DNA-binding NtrC family response regulator